MYLVFRIKRLKPFYFLTFFLSVLCLPRITVVGEMCKQPSVDVFIFAAALFHADLLFLVAQSAFFFLIIFACIYLHPDISLL